MKIAVIGIEQSLRGDDACGLETLRKWQEKYPETANRPEVSVEASELPGLDLINMIDGSDAAILVDAVKSSAQEGTIHLLEPDELFAFASDSRSAHGWGVAETLQLCREINPKLGNIPIKLIGIEIGHVDMGRGMSASVRQAIPLACEAIQTEIESLLS